MYLGVVISGLIRVLLININIFTVFCWSFVSSYYIRFNLRRNTLVTNSLASSLAGSLVDSLTNSLVGSSASSLVSFLASSLVGSLVGLDYKYNFTVIVLKLVGPLISYTLYISPSIPSNLYRPVHLLS